MILVADIGGTHSRLGLVEELKPDPVLVQSATFPSREFFRFEDILEQFFASRSQRVSGACLAVAGPVRGGQVRITNLSWNIDADSIRSRLRCDWVRLMNDLEAGAWTIPSLPASSLAVLNPGEPVPGNQAVISAGTGLGEAFLFWDGAVHHPSPSEGSHADFGARSDLEADLARFLRPQFGHVSYERVVSGLGLKHIYEFLRGRTRKAEPAWLSEELTSRDPAVVISEAALSGKSTIADLALDLFVSIYGAEAGNLALKTMAVGGVFLCGSLALAILPRLEQGGFMAAFTDKGRFAEMMSKIPVKVILDPLVGLKGAARAGLQQPP